FRRAARADRHGLFVGGAACAPPTITNPVTGQDMPQTTPSTPMGDPMMPGNTPSTQNPQTMDPAKPMTPPGIPPPEGFHPNAMDECGLNSGWPGDEYCIKPPPADKGFQ